MVNALFKRKVLASIRWKTNVKNIPKPLEMLYKLRGVYFVWDEEHGGQHDVGFIAKEVGKVLPEIAPFENQMRRNKS